MKKNKKKGLGYFFEDKIEKKEMKIKVKKQKNDFRNRTKDSEIRFTTETRFKEHILNDNQNKVSYDQLSKDRKKFPSLTKQIRIKNQQKSIYEKKNGSQQDTESEEDLIGFLLSVRYNSITNRAQLIFWDNLRKQTFICDDSTGHRPYCLTQQSTAFIKNNPKIDSTRIEEIQTISLMNRLLDKKEDFQKVITNTPMDVPKIRDFIVPTWESRIRYHLCWIYDREMTPGIYYRIKKEAFEPYRKVYSLTDQEQSATAPIKNNPRYREVYKRYFPFFRTEIPKIPCVAFDIEVVPKERRMPKPDNPIDPILCCCLASSEGNTWSFYLTGKSEKEVLIEKISDLHTIKAFTDEIELVEEIIAVLERYPIILSYNGNTFDIPYLKNRCYYLDKKFKSSLSYNFRRKISSIKTGIHLDLFNWFQNPAIKIYAYGNSYERLTLNSVSLALLKKGKTAKGAELQKLNKGQLVDYCLNDTLLTMELFTNENFEAFNLMVILARITHMPLDELVNTRVSNWLKNLFYYEHRINKSVIPNKRDIAKSKGTSAQSKATIKDKKYQGAIVFDPVPGIHFNVDVLDFASLYPSIISTRNLSYETINCHHKSCRQNILPGTTYWSCNQIDGFISTMVGFLRDIRVFWFKPFSKHPGKNKKFYRTLEKSLKVLINAAYGVMGSEYFELYCLPVAEATTAIGRDSILRTVQECQKLGIQVLYGDTDSVFIKSASKEQVKELISWSSEKLKIELDREKTYRFCALSNRKKNYIGVLKNGEVDIKGLTGKKRNTPPAIQAAFSAMIEILREVHVEEDFTNAKERIKKLLKKCYRDLEKGIYKLEDLTFTMQLTKPINQYTVDSQHVKAAKQLLEAKYQVKAGQFISFLKTTNSIGVCPIELASNAKIDIKAYKSQIDSTFAQVLDSIGLDIEEIKGKVNIKKFF